MVLSKPDPSNPSSTRILSKFVNLTNSPMDAISFQVRWDNRILILDKNSNNNCHLSTPLFSKNFSSWYWFLGFSFEGCRAEVFEARDVPRQQHSHSSQQPWSGNTGDQSGELNAWGKEHHVEAQDWLYTGGHIGKMLNGKTRFNIIFYETISNDIVRFSIIWYPLVWNDIIWYF